MINFFNTSYIIEIYLIYLIYFLYINLYVICLNVSKS